MNTTNRDFFIVTTLKTLGVSPRLLGYSYLKSAINLVLEDPEYQRALTKRLYPKIAEMHLSTPSRVERAIRHSIETAWDRGDIYFEEELFGYTVSADKGKPTNSEFIATVVDYVSMSFKEETDGLKCQHNE